MDARGPGWYNNKWKAGVGVGRRFGARVDLGSDYRMRDEARQGVGHLAARVAAWSLVSLPAFWIPLYWEYRYPITDSRMGMIAGFFVPFLALAAIMSLHTLIQLPRVLRSASWSRRCLLTLAVLTLSFPSLAPLMFMAFTIIRVAAQR